MADPLSGVAIIICIAFGILTIVLLFIFANRQIKRFSLKSKYCPHTPIAHDAPKSLQNEISRRLDVIKSITYQPPLLKKTDEMYFEDEHTSHMPCHLYRMKALDSLPTLDAAILSADPSKVRPYHQNYRVYLIRLAQSGLFGQTEMTVIHKFVDLYEAARHEPGEFDQEQYTQFINLMTQIQDSISNKSPSQHQQQSINNTVTNTVPTSELAESVKNSINVKTCTVSSSLKNESSEEDKATYETSV